MTLSTFIAVALFLPLFPFSMAFIEVLERLRSPWQRVALLAVWPQIGIWGLSSAAKPLPDWLVAWALASALFYAFRALALREAGLWIGFIAVSAWPLLLIGAAGHPIAPLQALAFSLPLALMTLVTGAITDRFGAAHTALDLRLATSAPRLAALFAVSIFAVGAMPVFPNFFVLIATVTGTASTAPLTAIGVLAVWLLWTWSGARLLQGLLIGPLRQRPVLDLSPNAAWAFAGGFTALALAGLLIGGKLL